MKSMMLALLVGIALWWPGQNNGGAVHDTFYAHSSFTVSAQKVGVDTHVTLVYPDLKNIWVCVTFRRVNDQLYAPRWCFEPAKEHSEVVVIPRWPPAAAHGVSEQWEFYAFLQYSVGENDVNGYIMTGWQELH